MEHLQILAEISVALAGFSSIIVVFRRAGSDGAPSLRSGVYLFGVTWLTIGAGLMFYGRQDE